MPNTIDMVPILTSEEFQREYKRKIVGNIKVFASKLSIENYAVKGVHEPHLDTFDITFYVPREEYEAAEEFFCDHERIEKCLGPLQQFRQFKVKFEQAVPELVQANVGDYVLLFYDLMYKPDEECDVGLVTAKYPCDDGFAYGVRYVQVNLNSHPLPWEVVKLTEETYGGYHKGFLKVLTAEEMTARLNKKAAAAAAQLHKTIDAQLHRSGQAIKEFVANVSEGKREMVERLTVRREKCHFAHLPEAMYSITGRQCRPRT